MPFALLLITVGGVLVASALKGQGVTEYLRGMGKTLNPAGGSADIAEIGKTTTTAASNVAEDAIGVVTSTLSGKSGTSVPKASYNPLGKPIANWIVANLDYAAKRGWKGTVASGYRTAAEQTVAAGNYGLSHYPSGVQASNHRTTDYPGGAVDVSEPESLDAILTKGGPTPRLVWSKHSSNAVDTVHFSAHGN